MSSIANDPSRRLTAVGRVAAKAGGVHVLARWCGVHVSTVSHWNQPGPATPGGDRRGRDGRIPDRYHQRILSHASLHGVAIAPAELINDV